jgi:excisionase family DNA binding protein
VIESGVRLDEPLLNAKEASALLNIATSSLYELARTGQLPVLRLGRNLRWTRGMLEDALSTQLNPGGSE